MADVPAFDDIPSFDEMSDQAPAPQATAPLRFDDIPSFDDIPASGAPQAEGPIASNVRAAAHGIIPAAGAVVGGALAGAGMGLLGAGPVGAFVGGIAGGVAGGMGGDIAQDKLQSAIPAIDDRQQMAADEQVYPKSMAVSGMAPFIGNPAGGLVKRAGNAAMLGLLDAGQQEYQTGHIDPAQSLAVGAFGAAFPNGNRATDALGGAVDRLVPGRPGRTANPDAAQAHADVDDSGTEINIEGSSLAQQAPAATGETVGARDDNKPTNSQGVVATGKADSSYMKTPPPADNSQMSTGDISPDIQAAMAPPQQRPLGMSERNYRAPKFDEARVPDPAGVGAQPQPDDDRQRAQPVQQHPQQPGDEPVVSTGMPEAGEPVAVGENDATPFPAGTPERAQAAIAKSKSAADVALATHGGGPAAIKFAGKSDTDLKNDWLDAADKPKQRAAIEQELDRRGVAATERAPAPEIEGHAATPTPAQAEAGNYTKARTMDFGKPIAIETHAGEVRQGKGWEHKLPYDYGYFNKTMGPDGDHIDFARPAEGSPERGSKHFIIDQKNATTGKYDEPKVFTHVKDEATARDLFNRGFGDGKGPDRLHDITEVQRGDLVKYLAKHTKNPPKGPYGNPMPKEALAKPLQERAVVKATVEKLRAQGKTAEAEKLLNAPPEALAAAIEGKRVRKYGVDTGASAGYPVEGLLNSEGKPVTANTKAEAQKRSDIHNSVKEFFDVNKGTAGLEKGAALSKIKTGLDALHSYDVFKKGKLELLGKGTWAPSHKPAEWLWAREAKNLLKKPTPGQWEKFKDADRLLRGKPEDVDTYRGSNRIEADIANSRRGGDEAVQHAEEAMHIPGRNDEEERMLENIGRQRGDFDVPHEEAEEMVKPRKITKASDIKEPAHKTVDITKSSLAEPAKKSVAKMSLKELTEAPKPAPKKEAFEAVTAAGEGKSVKGKFTAEQMKAMVDRLNGAANRKGLSDDEIKRMDFLRDESGSVNVNKIGADLKQGKDWLSKKMAKLLETTPVKSYRAADIKSPTNLYANDLSEDLHLNDNLNTMHKQENIRKAQVLERDADRPSLERIYKAREADSAHLDLPGKQAGKTNLESLSPSDLKIWNEHLKPISDETEQFKNDIRAMDPDRMGPDVEHYIARVAKGDTSEFNVLKRNDDPTGPTGMAINAGMAKERMFHVLERNADGRRFVVMERPNGLTKWEGGKAERIKAPDYSFEANQPFQVKGKQGNVDYTMRHATADEIEKSGAKFDLGKGRTMDAAYHQNAGLSVYLAHAKLGEMARNLTELAKIKSSPEFQSRMTRNGATAKDKGYITTTHPNFAGDYLDPRLAHLLDDYSRPGFNTWDTLRNLNQGVTKLLFWMPTAHIGNVGAHWFVGRGADWFTAPGWHRLAKTGPRAIKSVLNQDITQQRLMSSGASMIYPSVQTRDFIGKIAKSVGEDMVSNPSKWGPVADAFHVPLDKLSKAVYDNSSKVMWAANDMFMTQRVLELEMKGHSTEQAVKQAERDIPNYRVPSQLFSGAKAGTTAEFGRFMSKVLQDPAVSSFGRYHYGMWNSYANMFKDGFSKASKPGDRIEAAGKLMALGLLAFAVYPALDKMSKMVTGNDSAEQQRRGPMSLPTHAYKAATGQEDIASAGRASLTIPPFWSTLLEAYNNKDFRGKSIVEPGDMAAGFRGDAYRGGKAAVQMGEHFARGLVSPLGTFSTAEKKADEPGAAGVAKAVGRGVRDQALDEKNPSLSAQKFQRKQGLINDKNARQREKKGGYGPLEEAYIKTFR